MHSASNGPSETMNHMVITDHNNLLSHKANIVSLILLQIFPITPNVTTLLVSCVDKDFKVSASLRIVATHTCAVHSPLYPSYQNRNLG